MESCMQNSSKDEFLVSPCLKPKGHTGAHQHEGLCLNMSCICDKDYKNNQALRQVNGFLILASSNTKQDDTMKTPEGKFDATSTMTPSLTFKHDCGRSVHPMFQQPISDQAIADDMRNGTQDPIVLLVCTPCVKCEAMTKSQYEAIVAAAQKATTA